jgi:hypothetical protein
MDASRFPRSGAALSVCGAKHELAQNTTAPLDFTTKLTDVIYALTSTILLDNTCVVVGKNNGLQNFWTRVGVPFLRFGIKFH